MKWWRKYKTIMLVCDLHLHSTCSDGTDSPEEVIRKAAIEGMDICSLTDHDGVFGVPDAIETGNKIGVTVIPGIEMDTEWSSEVHILGLGIDYRNRKLVQALETARIRREKRNEGIISNLERNGIRVRSSKILNGERLITRMHIAQALVELNMAKNTQEAFEKYLSKGGIAYCHVNRYSPEQVISLIKEAGGVAFWAHPFHLKGNIHEMADRMNRWGLQGIEAFHPSQSEGESGILCSIARQYGWMVSCGSDYHGNNKPGIKIGCTWRENTMIQQTCEFLSEKANIQSIKNGRIHYM